MVRVPHLRTIAAGLALGLLAGACTSDDQPPPPTGPTGNSSGMVAVAASVDLYRGDPQRLAFGLIMPDNSLVSFGTVDVAFSLLGSAGETAAPEAGPTATATFVPTFGMPDASSGPVVTSPTEGRGVYQATDVVFDTAGFWVAEVTADIEGLGPQTAEASFAVLEEPAAGSGRLEADEENRGLRIGKAATQVVQDAPPRRHAARGDDDGGAAHVVDGPGLLHGSGQLEPRGVKRTGSREHGLRGVRVEVLGVGAVQARRLDRHGAVDVGRQPRNPARILERSEVVDKLLGPANGEGRYHQGGTAGHRRLDNALDLVGHGLGVVQQVAIG